MYITFCGKNKLCKWLHTMNIVINEYNVIQMDGWSCLQPRQYIMPCHYLSNRMLRLTGLVDAPIAQ